MLGTDGDAAYAAIALRALARNRERLTEVAALVERASGADEPEAAEARSRASELAHQVAGSAGTFGRDEASVLAREVMGLLADGASPEQVRAVVEAAQRSLED